MDPQLFVDYLTGDHSVVPVEQDPLAKGFNVVLFIRPEDLPQALFRPFDERLRTLSALLQRRMGNVKGTVLHARR